MLTLLKRIITKLNKEEKDVEMEFRIYMEEFGA